MEKDPEKGTENNPEDSSLTWGEFVQNTTIHGVKYIFEGIRVRR